jgi:hypothetical protein
MSNFFEQELRKLFGDGAAIEDPTFVGRVCMGTLGKNLCVRAQYVTSGYADHYVMLIWQILALCPTIFPQDVLRFMQEVSRWIK